MSDRRLPDDLSQWPSDPFELLGVSLEADDKTLRRAYTALIRIYKPEQRPAEFRRIREAYDVILRHREFFAQFRSNPPDAAEPAPAAEPSVDPPEPLHAPRPVPIDPVATAWTRAIEGDLAGAFRDIRELQHQGRAADARLRLYWLATLEPGLDPDRKAVHWLVEELRACDMEGPAVELYRRELWRRPDAAIEAGGLLLESHARPASFVEVMGRRWQVAIETGRHQLVLDEYGAVKSRLADDPDAWLQLLAMVVDVEVWRRSPAITGLVGRLRDDLRALEFLHVASATTFDRMEHADLLAQTWPAIRDNANAPPELKKLLPLYWSRPYDAIRDDVEECLAAISESPVPWLRFLRAIPRKCPEAVPIVENVLFDYRIRLNRMPEPPAPPVLALLARRLARRSGLRSDDPKDLATRAMQLCVPEFVHPQWLTPYLPNPGLLNSVRAIAQVLQDDWSLGIVCEAHLLYWASLSEAAPESDNDDDIEED